MHSIIAKEPSRDSATTELENELLTINDSVHETIIQRLIDALGRDSKSFELEIKDSNTDSFYDLCHDLKLLSDDDFIAKSQEIAELLAGSQVRSLIPGGFVIIIDAELTDSDLAVYVIIKAELHQALKFIQGEDGHSQIELLDQIFLSPSQKLFKIGILYEKNLTQVDPNARFGCILFDDQFRVEGHPAEYFYKQFLGFSVDSNAKIQSRRFYDKTESFIKSNVADIDIKKDLLKVLKTEFTVNNNPVLTPSQFAETYFPDRDIKDEFLSQVAEELPSSFVKNPVMIVNKLKKKNMDFPNNINIIGPDEHFDAHVSIIQNNEEFLALTPVDSTYTIVKINGKPFCNE